mgnify:CR=1 FL=1
MVNVKEATQKEWENVMERDDVWMSPEYDYKQFNHLYEYYYLFDSGYWDAYVAWDTIEEKPVAVFSHVMGEKEAKTVIEDYKKGLCE